MLELQKGPTFQKCLCEMRESCTGAKFILPWEYTEIPEAVSNLAKQDPDRDRQKKSARAGRNFSQPRESLFRGLCNCSHNQNNYLQWNSCHILNNLLKCLNPSSPLSRRRSLTATVGLTALTHFEYRGRELPASTSLAAAAA